MSHAGRGLLFLSIGISVYNIAVAEDKVVAVGREVTVTGAGIGGGIAGGALAGLTCGPGAPICTTVGAFVGGRWLPLALTWSGRAVINASSQRPRCEVGALGYARPSPRCRCQHWWQAYGRGSERRRAGSGAGVPGQLLLFTTMDVPYEDTLGIHLLTADGKLLDTLSLGGPYSTGALRDLRVVGAHTVRFRFLGGTDWNVTGAPREPALRYNFCMILPASPGLGIPTTP